MRILIAEDDPVSLLALSRILEKNGYTPVAVTDGAQAIEARRSGSFSIVITEAGSRAASPIPASSC